ncbi:MAG TPA: ROK family protein [Streptosporangiaceae bacterium]|nr:ROK family protein [Streptosporangiaceae bacterium]
MTDAAAGAGFTPARPQLIRTMNEQLLLNQIRQLGLCSRADLARLSGLSKPTVSLALANVERSGLVRTAGQRTGVPGRSAVLYEIRPEAGYVLGLDIGHEYLRGAITDLTGEIRAKAEARCPATSVSKRVSELVRLADGICSAAGVTRAEVTQTVLGSPGVYDPRRDAITLTGGMAGWDRPAVLAGLRGAFGENLAVENDTDAAALAEREHGHGREFTSFVFVSIGTGIGMGLVLGGQLHRGAHGVAGEIAFLPITEGPGDVADDEVRRRGALEAVGSAAAIVRAARRAGLRTQSARQVFAAAAAGDERAVAIVAAEARLVAKAICAIVAVVDPGLVVLGGGIGQAPGFAAAVRTDLGRIAPVLPDIRVSALGTSAVVDGCLASGADLAWGRLTAQLAQAQADQLPAAADGDRGGRGDRGDRGGRASEGSQGGQMVALPAT